jgi:Ca2+-binding RTX toxin-like protein
VETIVGGSNVDTITLGHALTTTGMSIDLGGGVDTLNLGNFTNSGSISNVESLLGNSGDDTITYATQATNVTIDLAGGSDTIKLGNFVNTASISNVETILGGSGVDTITVQTQLVNGSIDLGASTDRLTLGNFTNSVTVANVETLIGGTGDDTITVSAGTSQIRGGGGIDHITGSAGADTFIFDQNASGSYMVIENMGTGADKIGLDTNTSSTLGGNTYSISGALSTTNMRAVDDQAVRLTTVLGTGGNGGFTYQKDTGALYYSADGDFTSGGMLIGVITTDGATPWTYDFTRFLAV